jgi:glycosyltransferase involved in cell wall biosynthesis
MSLSIVIPTLGRASLKAALESCKDADEIVVVLDTSRGTTELPCELPPNAVLHSGHFGVTGGHAGRQKGIELATGTHLAFFDDDDVYLPGAVKLMREAACDVPVIFRMDHYELGILWREPEIYFGNVSTQMYVVPNDPSRLGAWAPIAPHLPQPGGDCTFIKETVEKMGGVVWREEITSVLRPPKATIAIVTPWKDHPELQHDFDIAVAVRRSVDELIVVDNGSNPPIEGAIRLDWNSGFSHASNVGLQAATTDAVLFLNNDIYATDRSWLENIRRALEPGVLVGASLRFDQHTKHNGVDLPYIDGWCLAGMRDDLIALGGFDESYAEPAYYSDNDLCFRARLEGMTLRECRSAIHHKGGQTSMTNGWVLPETIANRERYIAMVNEALGVAS